MPITKHSMININTSGWVQAHTWSTKSYMTEKALVLRYFPEYPDASDRWSNYGEPKVAEVELDGPGSVTIGQEAMFDVYVTFKGEPYLNADVKYVKAILYNGAGETVLVAEATPVEEGHYVFTLTAEESAKLVLVPTSSKSQWFQVLSTNLPSLLLNS